MVLLLLYSVAAMGNAKISSKGQVAIPMALREAIDLRPGAEVSFELAGSAILLRPVPQFKPVTPKQGYGCIPHKGRAASEADIRRAARAAGAFPLDRRGEVRARNPPGPAGLGRALSWE